MTSRAEDNSGATAGADGGSPGTLRALRSAVSRLESLRAIEELTRRYAAGIDDRNWELFASVWTSTPALVLDPTQQPLDLAAIEQWLTQIWGRTILTRNYVVNNWIELSAQIPSQAIGLCQQDVVLLAADGTSRLAAATAYDNYERGEDSNWRIARRRLHSAHHVSLGTVR
jgi:hypothetical protein